MDEKKKTQCKNCKKPFTLFMAHLKKIEECQKAYGEEYQQMLEINSQKRKTYKKGYAEDNRETINEKQRDRRNADKAKTNEKQRNRRNADKEKTNEKLRIYRRKKEAEMTQEQRIKAFKRSIIDGPNFTCYSCKRRLFKNQVKILNQTEVTNLKTKLKMNILRQLRLHYKKNSVIFCHNCKMLINKSQIPKIHFSNGLWLDKVPEELKLTDLEQQLIARSLVFMKVKKLPTTRMKAMTDKVISVPIGKSILVQNFSNRLCLLGTGTFPI